MKPEEPVAQIFTKLNVLLLLEVIPTVALCVTNQFVRMCPRPGCNPLKEAPERGITRLSPGAAPAAAAAAPPDPLHRSQVFLLRSLCCDWTVSVR
ncbi:hypothetical protein WMY93_020896 [Mugilogobius chulae]|uniref:Uncharacterized protein n=1 Tax=Mugilogobius chulae TaxID=88201 RepID=A0AAW0NLH1_9GOBI